jgi:vancomycin permeability regulator SanA
MRREFHVRKRWYNHQTRFSRKGYTLNKIMLKRIFTFLRRLLFTLGILGVLGIIVPRLVTTLYSMNRIYNTEDAPTKRVAIVFGAGLRRDGTPTPILRDRVETAVSLYFNGKVEMLLMSGDNSYPNYSEPESMRQYALSLGVPEAAIALDDAGRRTYDTCFRAKAIFGVDDALLVTQKFHLPRALFLCNALGLEALGVDATTPRRSWRVSTLLWNSRELLATVSAFLDVYVTNPQPPVLGEPSPLFLD